MNRKLVLLLAATALAGCQTDVTSPTEPAVQTQFARTSVVGPHGALGTVYVSSQGLYYDTFVSAQKLPNEGPFQTLAGGVTEFGPGQPGYLGGRWWIDSNANGVRDDGDTFLLCPLLGPGRTSP